MASNEWTPWINHDGKGCPCVGKWVHVVYADGKEDKGMAQYPVGNSWYDNATMTPVLKYRIRKPRALSMLEKIARDVKIPVDA